MTDLNTSHVKVKPIEPKTNLCDIADLNTSHVKVKPREDISKIIFFSI